MSSSSFNSFVHFLHEKMLLRGRKEQEYMIAKYELNSKYCLVVWNVMKMAHKCVNRLKNKSLY